MMHVVHTIEMLDLFAMVLQNNMNRCTKKQSITLRSETCLFLLGKRVKKTTCGVSLFLQFLECLFKLEGNYC